MRGAYWAAFGAAVLLSAWGGWALYQRVRRAWGQRMNQFLQDLMRRALGVGLVRTGLGKVVAPALEPYVRQAFGPGALDPAAVVQVLGTAADLVRGVTPTMLAPTAQYSVEALAEMADGLADVMRGTLSAYAEELGTLDLTATLGDIVARLADRLNTTPAA